jgi:hypothetical protein
VDEELEAARAGPRAAPEAGEQPPQQRRLLLGRLPRGRDDAGDPALDRPDEQQRGAEDREGEGCEREHPRPVEQQPDQRHGCVDACRAEGDEEQQGREQREQRAIGAAAHPARR